MDPEATIRSRQRASGGESRTVYASTFVAATCWLASVALKPRTGRANKVAGEGAQRAAEQTQVEWHEWAAHGGASCRPSRGPGAKQKLLDKTVKRGDAREASWCAALGTGEEGRWSTAALEHWRVKGGREGEGGQRRVVASTPMQRCRGERGQAGCRQGGEG